MASNVLGGGLELCSKNPVTGFFRNGLCDTCADDRGMHTVCVVMTDEFLEFSAGAGNDLTAPVPEYGFPGLKAGDRWLSMHGALDRGTEGRYGTGNRLGELSHQCD